MSQGVVSDAHALSDVQLSRTLKSRHVSMITFGGIIGAGLFVGSSTAINSIGPAASVSYALGGILVLLVMRMLSEMAVALPGTQTFPDFARQGIGQWAGFMVGWLYWYFWVAVIAIEVIAGAKIIDEWMRQYGAGLPRFELWQIGVVLLAIMTAINLMSAKSYGEFEFWFASTKVVAILVFIAVAGAFAFGLTSPTGPTLSNLTSYGGFAPFGATAMLVGVPTVIFAMCGAEIATLAAAESEDGSKVIARMTLSVAARITIFYVLAMLMVVAVVPWTEIKPGVSPFAHALRLMGYANADLMMNAIVLVAVLSCLNSGIYITSRAMFGLAQNGDAPQAFVKLSGSKVPVRAILIASLFSYGALAASVLSPDRVFNFLVTSTGTIMLFIYILIAWAQINLRNQIEAEAPDRLEVRMWWHPYGTLLTIVAMLAILVLMGATQKHAPELWASALVTAAFGLGYGMKLRLSQDMR